MINYCINNYMVKNSKGITMRFFQDKENRIKYDLYDNQQDLVDQYLISEDKVNCFSLDIDNRDRTHLIYLTNEGSLNYYLYSNNQWAKKKLIQFDTKSNYYNNLTLKINKESIHILIASSNIINSKVWTIQHLIGTKGNWEKKNIISFTSTKSIPSYFFDFDKFDNLHMIYNACTDDTKRVYYTYYNSSSKKWSQSPQLLSDPKYTSIQTYLFVDKKDNIHVTWLKQENNLYIIQYRHLSQLGNSRNIWKEESLPILNCSYTYPIIIEYKDTLRLFIKDKDLVKCIISKNYGYTWELSDYINVPIKDSIILIKYITNFLTEKNMQKINHSYLFSEDIKTLIKLGPIDYYKKSALTNKPNSSSNDMDIESSTNLENNIIVNEEYSSVQEKVGASHQNISLDNVNKGELIIETLLDILNDVSYTKTLADNITLQLRNIDNTILTLKESINLNNQYIVDIDKKIKEVPKRGLWQKFFDFF